MTPSQRRRLRAAPRSDAGAVYDVGAGGSNKEEAMSKPEPCGDLRSPGPLSTWDHPHGSVAFHGATRSGGRGTGLALVVNTRLVFVPGPWHATPKTLGISGVWRAFAR